MVNILVFTLWDEYGSDMIWLILSQIHPAPLLKQTKDSKHGTERPFIILERDDGGLGHISKSSGGEKGMDSG